MKVYKYILMILAMVLTLPFMYVISIPLTVMLKLWLGISTDLTIIIVMAIGVIGTWVKAQKYLNL